MTNIKANSHKMSVYLEDQTKHRIINKELFFFIRHLTYFKIIFRTGNTGELVMFPK